MTEATEPYGGAEDEAYTVRPYAVTGGRVSAANSDLPMEALVEAPSDTQESSGLDPGKEEDPAARCGTISIRC